ncbi:MAG: cytochrome c, partial [Steroidobacteraceae bacterium]
APNNARLLVYKLGGKATLPTPPAYTRAPLNPPPNFGDDALRARGQAKYNENCGSCHGNDGRVGNLFPDLRYAQALSNPALFKAIVIDGAFQSNGMVSFRKVVTVEEAEAIRAYVVSLANIAKTAPPEPPRAPRGGQAAAQPAAGATPVVPAAPAGAAVTPAAPALHQ